ncbi:hypothetical protein HPG69_002737, partial [Diceros bicornis minor]
MVQQESIREEGLQKGPVTVIALKAMKPFEFETQEGKQEMFHAMVATESEFFFVRVFNKKLKDKFTSKKIIIISKYYWHTHFLEENSASLVSDVKSEQPSSVPKHFIRKACQNTKVNKLQTQPLAAIVNGLLGAQNVKNGTEESYIIYLRHNTGSVGVLVLRQKNKIKCEDGNKLNLTFFELSKIGEKQQLKSGVYSFIK